MQQMQFDTLVQAYKAAFPLYWRVCLVVLAGTLAFSFIMPTTWTASTTILPPEEKPSSSGLGSLLQGAPVSFGQIGGGNKVSLLYTEILQSRTLLEGVIDTLSLEKSELFAGNSKDEIVKQLSNNIDIENRRTGSVTVTVALRSKWLPFLDNSSSLAKQECANVANACAKVLDKLNRDKSTTQARSTRAYIERVMKQTKSEIDTLQKHKLDFQNQYKVIALDEQMQALVNHAVTIGTELATAELELAMVKQDFANTSPQVQMLNNKVAALREQYDRVQRGGLVDSDGFSIPFADVPELTRTYGNLLRDLKIKEQINAYLETQRMEQIIQEAKDLPTVVVLDPAVIPISRTSPSRGLQLPMAFFAITILFGIGVPFRKSLLRG